MLFFFYNSSDREKEMKGNEFLSLLSEKGDD